LKITKVTAQAAIKDIQVVRDQIDDMKWRLQELSIMAAKYGNTDKVDEELLYYKEKLTEMDDRIAKIKIEIDVTNQINENKRNELRNRDEYTKRLRLMIEMRRNIPEPVIVPPPKVE
jgi:TolA-binding protein